MFTRHLGDICESLQLSRAQQAQKIDHHRREHLGALRFAHFCIDENGQGLEGSWAGGAIAFGSRTKPSGNSPIEIGAFVKHGTTLSHESESGLAATNRAATSGQFTIFQRAAT